MAIVGFACDDPDSIGFVALRDIPEGTEISFTDNGWLAAGNFRTGEGYATYTAPSGGLAAGTVVVLVSPSLGSINLSASADQVFAYQGTVDGSGVLTGALLYGVNDSGAGVWQDEAISSHSSALPPSLAGANVALPELDNYAYDPSKINAITTGTRAALLAAINNPDNWTGDDEFPPSYPLSFTVTPAAADVLAFTAARTEAGVRLEWRTGAELACGTFAIARCDLASGPCDTGAAYRELDGTVPCTDEPMGAAYDLTDLTAEPGAAYAYSLRLYDTAGGITFHGPVRVAAVGVDEATTAGAAAQGCSVAGGAAAAAAPLALLLALVVRRRRRR